MVDLSISIVTYAPDLEVLDKTLKSLETAIHDAWQTGVLSRCYLFLVDNGPGDKWAEVLEKRLKTIKCQSDIMCCQLISGHGNIGYGRAHNLAVSLAHEKFHLVLNPDVIINQNALQQALQFLLAHPDVGMLNPRAEDAYGERLFLCKRYPSILDLALRAWAPCWMRKLFRRRLEQYEMRDQYGGAEEPFDAPIVSGCFLFCRRTAWEAVGGFSPEYFLYFEDFDLSLRMTPHARVVYVPSVRIVHSGGGAGRKGWRHVWMFIRSAWIFFNAHGWKLA